MWAVFFNPLLEVIERSGIGTIIHGIEGRYAGNAFADDLRVSF